MPPAILPQIHAYLFQDLPENVYHPGSFKTERMVKQEEILNGDSVLYADPSAYGASLDMAFNAESKRRYATFTDEELQGFCHTVAFLWQVHPFYEGNTRTVAVFSELYLNYLGFHVGNDPFAHHARYYRDALVRAMYRNPQAGVFPEAKFLIGFYQNVLGLADNPLNREDLICTALFEHPELLKNVSPDYALHKAR